MQPAADPAVATSTMASTKAGSSFTSGMAGRAGSSSDPAGIGEGSRATPVDGQQTLRKPHSK
jgi:hypothetical protein